MPVGSSQFRLLVSSTFLDFEAERELMRTDVFPRLRELCSQHDATFEAVDLRWGVSREAASDRRTLDICFEEVDRCVASTARPNFLLLVGDRLGWRPLPTTLDEDTYHRLSDALTGMTGARLLKRWYPRTDTNAVPSVRHIREPEDATSGEEELLLKAIESVVHLVEMSPAREALLVGGATEQEARHRLEIAPVEDASLIAVIRYLENPQAGSYASVWRDRTANGEPDDIAATRLDCLRRDVFAAVGPDALMLDARLVNGSVDDAYLAEFSITVHDRLKAVIDRELADRDASPFGEREDRQHRDFGRRRAIELFGREVELAKIADWLSEPQSGPLVVHGPSGIGKTSLMGAATSAESFPKTAIVRFVGATGPSSEPRGLVTSLLAALRPNEEIAPTFEAAADQLASTLESWPEDQPITIVVDALDQLGLGGYERWLGSLLPDSIHLLLSVADGPDLERLSDILSTPVWLPIDRLPAIDASAALDRWLKDLGRRLQPNQRRAVLDAFSQTGLPLHLRLLFEHARTWRSDHDPEQIAQTSETALAALLKRLSKEHGLPLVETALTCLVSAREGLSPAEIMDVLSLTPDVMNDFTKRYEDSPPVPVLPPVIWSRFFYDMEPYLTERERRGAVTLDFFHRQVRDAVSNRWLTGKAKRDRHRRLAAYFLSQPTWLGDGEHATPNRRKSVELPFHLAEAADISGLEDLFSDPDTLTAFVAARGAWELAEDLQRAAQLDPNSILLPLRDAARAAAPIVAADPSVLPSQLLGRLPSTHTALSDRLRNGPWPRPWLEPLAPTLAKGGLMFTLDGHKGTVRSVAVSHDGRWCATAGNSSNDRTVRLWSLDTGKNIHTFEDLAAEGGWTPIAFDHLGHLLVGLRQTVLTIEPRSGSSAELLRCDANVTCVAAAAEAPLIAVGTADGTVMMHRSGRTTHAVHVAAEPVSVLAPSTDGRRCAAVIPSGIVVMDSKGMVESEYETDVGTVLHWGVIPLAITNGGRDVRFGGRLREWTIGDPDDRSLIGSGGYEAPRAVLALTPDGEQALVSPGLDNVRDQAFDPGQNRMVAGWVVGRETVGPARPDPGSDVSAAAITTDGRYGIVAHADHSVRVWDLNRSEDASLVTRHDNPIEGILLEGDYAYVRDRGNIITRWDLTQGTRQDDIESSDALLDTPGADRSTEPPPILASFEHEAEETDRQPRAGELVPVIVKQEPDRWFEIAEAHLAIKYTRAPGKVGEAPDPPDEDMLLAPFDVWRLDADGAPVERLHRRAEDRTTHLTQVAATADGAIAVAAAYGSLRTYDLTTFQQLHRLEGHEGPIWEIDLLDDAGLVASVSEDATARVWNITNGALVAVFHGESPMKAVRITTVNGHVVVIAGEDSGRVHTLRLRLDCLRARNSGR